MAEPMLLLPEPSPEVRRYLENVCERVCAGEVPAPPWIAVDDGGGQWFLEAARRQRTERARAVFATTDENALIKACRLGIGGAILLPPSTPATAAALSVAAANEPLDVDIDLLSWCSVQATTAHLVTWANVAFWRHHFGGPLLCEMMHHLADRLRVVPTMLGLPALLVPEIGAEDIEAAWADLTCGRRDVPAEGLRLVAFDSVECSGAMLWLEATAALTARVDDEVAVEMVPQSIYALPRGRRVGQWSAAGSAGDGVWRPQPAMGGGLSWSDGDTVVAEVVDSGALAEHEGEVVRVPGWLTARLRPGAPNGVLLGRLASAAKRHGVTLWVPNADQTALDHLLRLNVSLWVDGPAVPD